MTRELRVIMLVDDNPGDNYFHVREIKKVNPEFIIIEKITGLEALEYLNQNRNNHTSLPELIFLDINMPIMDGWEFLDEFLTFDKELQNRVIIMLSTSDNPDDISKALKYKCVSEFLRKPLTVEIVRNIIQKYFTIANQPDSNS